MGLARSSGPRGQWEVPGHVVSPRMVPAPAPGLAQVRWVQAPLMALHRRVQAPVKAGEGSTRPNVRARSSVAAPTAIRRLRALPQAGPILAAAPGPPPEERNPASSRPGGTGAP